MTTKIEAKKEIHYRCKKCLPAEALAKEGGDESTFYACPVVNAKHSTTGVRLIGNEADREEIRKERKQ